MVDADAAAAPHASTTFAEWVDTAAHELPDVTHDMWFRLAVVVVLHLAILGAVMRWCPAAPRKSVTAGLFHDELPAQAQAEGAGATATAISEGASAAGMRRR